MFWFALTFDFYLIMFYCVMFVADYYIQHVFCVIMTVTDFRETKSVKCLEKMNRKE